MRRSFPPLLPHSRQYSIRTLATNKPFPPTRITNIARDKQTLSPDQDYKHRPRQTNPSPRPGLQTSPATNKPFPPTRITNIARDKQTLSPDQNYKHRPRQTNPFPRPGLQTSPATNKPFPPTRITNIARDKQTLPPDQDYKHRPRQTNPSPRPGLQTSPVTNKPFPPIRLSNRLRKKFSSKGRLRATLVRTSPSPIVLCYPLLFVLEQLRQPREFSLPPRFSFRVPFSSTDCTLFTVTNVLRIRLVHRTVQCSG